jgi:hypothetical protein
MSRAVTVSAETPQSADLSGILDRVLVFDDLFSPTQILLLERWALETPHWMLTNSVHDAQGKARHRFWGASYIQAWRRSGWPGLPPVLLSALATTFQRLDVMITEPEYIGLNGQSRGQQAAQHVDCARDAPDQLSFLIYIGENTDGDLLLFDKDEPHRMIEAIAFRPNRVVAMDGSIPHRACAPGDEKFRMSVIVRGKYECRSFNCATPRAFATHLP